MKRSEKQANQLNVFENNKLPPININKTTLTRIGHSPVLYLNNKYLYAPLLFYFLSINNQQSVLGRTYRSGIFCIECNTDRFIEIHIDPDPKMLVENIRFSCNQCKKTSLTCYYEFRSAIDIALLPTIKDEQVVISEDGKKIKYKVFREEILEKAQTIIYDPNTALKISI